MENYLKTLWGKIIAFGGGVLVIFGIIDYVVKWGIYTFILEKIIEPVISLVLNNMTPLILFLIVIWIIFLTIRIKDFLFRNPSSRADNVSDSKFNEDFEEIKKTVKFLRENSVILKNNFDKETGAIKSRMSELEDDTYEVKREIFKNQAKEYEEKGQEGGILCRINLLEMDIKKNWDFRIHDTLNDILKYLQSHSVFSQSASKLKNTLEKLPVEYDLIKQKILDSIKFH